MPLWRLFYHVVFATAGRHPTLSPELRALAARLLRRKAEELDCVVHAIHAQPEHAHVVLSIPPSHAISTVVGQMKGASGRGLVEMMPPHSSFRWQEGFGVFSFSEKSLETVVNYVELQDQHHAGGTLWPGLERVADNEETSASRAQGRERPG